MINKYEHDINVKFYWLIFWILVLSFLVQSARLEYRMYLYNKISYCNENYVTGELKKDVPLCVIELD